jgi:hypothetical protein
VESYLHISDMVQEQVCMFMNAFSYTVFGIHLNKSFCLRYSRERIFK